MIVIDTSVLIEILKRTQQGIRAAEALGDEPLSITAITVHELLVGKADTKIDLAILDYDARAATHSAAIERTLRGKGRMVNKADILIAGVCIANDATLATFDHDFTTIPGLDVKILT